VTGRDTTAVTGARAFGGAAAWLWLSIAAGLLAFAGSVASLAVHGVYADLTPAFLPQP
jgi:hypothetical protein